MNSIYSPEYSQIDFREHPDCYIIGRGEQGVLIVEPYKSEILPNWKFKTVAEAKISAEKIYSQFLEYKEKGDFVGMDMARKFIQMGFTRARRYANHSNGKKYGGENVRVQEDDWQTNEKAQSAQIFKTY